jgi:hypothetical protein
MQPRAFITMLCVCACDSVLGIEEATVDPGLASVQDVCAAYCDTVIENCTGEHAVYASRDACLLLCAHMPPGEPGATSGHSVECRLHAAELAPVETPFYCPGAGPGGNGVCGDNCESLCQLVQQVCTGDNQGFPDESACLDDCAALTDLGTFATDPGANLVRGPHLQCRLYHLIGAALEPDRHCRHALGEAPCQ